MRRPPQIPPTLLAVALIVLLAAAGCGEGATANNGSSESDAADSTASTPPSTATPAGGTTGAGGGNQQTGTTPPGSATPTTLQKQFPPADHLNKIVSAYTVASENPELLTGLPCYCPCELYGHGGVIDCHRSQHAAMCDVCMNEAIEANDLYQAQIDGGQPGDIAAAQAAVKDRYRRALVQQTAQMAIRAAARPTMKKRACLNGSKGDEKYIFMPPDGAAPGKVPGKSKRADVKCAAGGSNKVRSDAGNWQVGRLY